MYGACGIRLPEMALGKYRSRKAYRFRLDIMFLIATAGDKIGFGKIDV